MAIDKGVFIRIGGDASKFVRELDKAGREVSKFEGSTSAKMKLLGKSFAGLGASIATLSAGFAALSVVAANNAQEIINLSRVAGIGTDDFQNLARAAKSFGIEQDKLSDILKDVNDKVGDFLTTGAGGMVDFFEQVAPKVGVTADQFRNLNSADALQLYIDSLQKANLSQAEMTFHLEAIASDATLLLPLLQDNAAALKDLTENTDSVAPVTEVELERLSEMSKRLGLVADNITKATQRVVASDGFGNAFIWASDIVDDFAKKLSIIVDTTNGIPFTVEGLANKMSKIREEMKSPILDSIELQKTVNMLEQERLDLMVRQKENSLSGDKGNQGANIAASIERNAEELDKYREKLGQVKTEINEMELSYKELQAILQFRTTGEVNEGFEEFLTNLGYIAETTEETNNQVNESNTRALENQKGFFSSMLAMRENFNDATAALAEAEARRIEMIRKQLNAQLLSDVKSSMSLLFKEEKNAAYARTLISGYFSAQKAYEGGLIASGGNVFVAGGYAAASVAATIAQLQGINKTSMGSKGSPSTSSGGGATPSAAAVAPTTQQNVSISLTGDTFTRGQVTGLIDQINEAIADGAEIRLS